MRATEQPSALTLPSHVSRIVKLWRKDLEKVNPKAAESLADPMEYENLFPDIKLVRSIFFAPRTN